MIYYCLLRPTSTNQYGETVRTIQQLAKGFKDPAIDEIVPSKGGLVLFYVDNIDDPLPFIRVIETFFSMNRPPKTIVEKMTMRSECDSLLVEYNLNSIFEGILSNLIRTLKKLKYDVTHNFPNVSIIARNSEFNEQYAKKIVSFNRQRWALAVSQVGTTPVLWEPLFDV